ncbi:hypothetical protein GQ44DRAFT_48459, partial [Phaeosphaeriaceae sp. PMI808]
SPQPNRTHPRYTKRYNVTVTTTDDKTKRNTPHHHHRRPHLPHPRTSHPPITTPSTKTPNFPNLFDSAHPVSAFALPLFSLFGEGHTERADLRPLGPGTPSSASPAALNGTDWVDPILTALQRPLGEEVIVDGFDAQIPAGWKGAYQEGQFKALVGVEGVGWGVLGGHVVIWFSVGGLSVKHALKSRDDRKNHHTFG